MLMALFSLSFHTLCQTQQLPGKCVSTMITPSPSPLQYLQRGGPYRTRELAGQVHKAISYSSQAKDQRQKMFMVFLFPCFLAFMIFHVCLASWMWNSFPLIFPHDCWNEFLNCRRFRPSLVRRFSGSPRLSAAWLQGCFYTKGLQHVQGETRREQLLSRTPKHFLNNMWISIDAATHIVHSDGSPRWSSSIPNSLDCLLPNQNHSEFAQSCRSGFKYLIAFPPPRIDRTALVGYW